MRWADGPVGTGKIIPCVTFFDHDCINLWLSKVPKLPSLLPRLMLLLLKVCLMTGMTLGGPQCHLQIQFEKTEEEFVHNVRHCNITAL